jgi:hypothetical protein
LLIDAKAAASAEHLTFVLNWFNLQRLLPSRNCAIANRRLNSAHPGGLRICTALLGGSSEGYIHSPCWRF